MSFSVRRGTADANEAAKRAAGNPVYKLAARAGYVARGVLYAYMGYAALRISQTGAVRRADQQASLLVISGFPLGRFILFGGILAIGAYSVWGFVRAIYDPLRRGKDPVGIATRLGYAWSGLSYAALLFFAIGLVANGSSEGGTETTQQLAQRLLAAPAGVLLTEIVGLIGVAGGIGQFLEAYRAPFKKDEKREEMSEAERKISDALGRIGFIARGVVFSLMGWFIFLAARLHDPQQAKGFTGTFAYLLAQPYGRSLLALVALSFIGLGLHSVVLARYIRLPRNL
jgi:hypothetical protein